jgi:hypothetical protein
LPNEIDRIIYGMHFLTCRFTPKKLVLYFTTSECLFTYPVTSIHKDLPKKIIFERKEEKTKHLVRYQNKRIGKQNKQLK